MKSTFETIAELASAYCPVEDLEIKPGSNIETDLGIDSLNVLLIIMDVEEHFDIHINSEDVKSCVTIGDVVALVDRLVKESA